MRLDSQRYSHMIWTLVLLDFLLVVLCCVVTINLEELMASETGLARYFSLGLLVCLLAAMYVAGMAYAGAYRRVQINATQYFFISASALAVALGVFLSLSFFLWRNEELNRSVVVYFYVVMVVVGSLVRRVVLWWSFSHTSATDRKDRILVIGTGSRAERVVNLLDEHFEWGVKVVAYLDPEEDRVGMDIDGVKVVGTIDAISDVLKDNVIDEVVVAVPRSKLDKLGKIFAACEEEGVNIRIMSDVFDFQVARMRASLVGGVPLLSFEPVAQHELSLLVKRVFDVFAVVLALPVLLPLFAILALAVKLDSPGPVFFVQRRVGLRKRLFPMLKFRSMVVDAEAKLKDIEHLNEAEGPIFKIARDPRVTRVGAVMRKTSLDELPQLINVLLGHMTLVGPRPMSVRDVELFDRGIQRKRFSVRPGLTCLWQVSGRSNLPFEKWLELDLAYIDNWSLGLDFKILMKTVPVILKGEGAV